MNLPRIELLANDHALQARVARTAEERALGLQYRRELEPDEAMLFVNDEPKDQSYWMKDTPVALSIAFLEEDGTILSIADMTPLSERSHKSPCPVRYVLEVRQGWFDERGIAPGCRLAGAPFLGQGAGSSGSGE